MIWIAPSEKDTGNASLEKRLWDAANTSAKMNVPVREVLLLRSPMERP